MAEKKKQQTSSSSLIPGDTPANSDGQEPSEEEMLEFEEDSGCEDEDLYAVYLSTVYPSVDPPKTQRALAALDAALKKWDLHLAQPVSPPSSVSPSVYSPKTQSVSLWETNSTDSGVSMKSDSSMIEPYSFNPEKKQSCAVCEEAVMDPVLLPCGHWSCKQCSHSFWDEYGLTADDPCKKCGRRSEREKRDPDLRSVLLEKTIKRVEMETEMFQAEKEKFELEKRKLALEIQLLEQKGSYTNCVHGL